MLSHRIWDPKIAIARIAGLVASQWWGNQVFPPPRRCLDQRRLGALLEELYAEQSFGKEAGLKAIDEFAVGALMFDNSAPVAQSARLVRIPVNTAPWS